MTSKGSTPRVLRLATLPVRAALPVVAAAVLFGTVSPSAAFPAQAPASGERIRVKGFARIEAHEALAGGKLVVSGTVTDDAGHTAASAEVTLRIIRGSQGGIAASLSSARPEGCSDASKPPVLDGPENLLLPADASGRFCVRLSLPKDRYTGNLEVRATGSLDGTRLEMPLDLTLRPATLRFDRVRALLDLDENSLDITVVASTEEDGVTTPAAALWLGLTNETGATLGGATTDASGSARFAVPSARLGPPGRGELHVSFAGNADLGPTRDAVPVERRTRVDLVVPDASGGVRPLGSPEDGIAIPVVARARCTDSGCSAMPTGAVEARVGDAVVGAATLERGEARVLVTFALTGPTETPLRLRYAPDAPWFRPAGELVVTQPLRGPSVWKRWPLALAGAAAIAWLVMLRIPRRPLPRVSRPSPPHALRRGAHVEVVGETTSQGWTGQVIDADEDEPVVGANVAIERPGFERKDVLAHATTDDRGMFVLEPADSLPGDELSAEGPLHAPFRGPLPRSGDLRVALVLRRRALLDRLVSWARRRGRPFDLYPDPTPGQVRRAAGPDLSVVRWASAVERAAYGGDVVDEQAQGEVDRIAPSEAVDAKATSAIERPPPPRRRRPLR